MKSSVPQVNEESMFDPVHTPMSVQDPVDQKLSLPQSIPCGPNIIT